MLRVRESRGEESVRTEIPESTREHPAFAPPIEPDRGEPRSGQPAPRIKALGGLALLVGIGVVVLALVLAGGPSSKPTSALSKSPAHRPAAAHPTGGSTSSGAPTASMPSATPSSVPSPAPIAGVPTTTPTPAPNLASGDPAITSLDPATGSAGQRIVVVGANFLSSNGEIVASFNGETTSTSCPTQTMCTVTVPPPSGGLATQVTITTSRGTSNPVNFTYGQPALAAPPVTAVTTPPPVPTPTCVRPGGRCPGPGVAPSPASKPKSG